VQTGSTPGTNAKPTLGSSTISSSSFMRRRACCEELLLRFEEVP
jgi:hypothetical protein